MPLSDQGAVELEANAWGQQWLEGAPYRLVIDVGDQPPPAALCEHVSRRACMSFPSNTGLGADNIQPRAIARLSSELMLWLCRILLAAELLDGILDAGVLLD